VAAHDRSTDLDQPASAAQPAEAQRVSIPVVARIELLQQSAGNAAVARAFGDATSGDASALPQRARMEQAFGQSFAGVAAHVGTPQARRGLARLGARAAAFGESVAFADANPDTADIAHELAHVVQQRAGGASVQAKAEHVSEPGDAAEQAADRAADAVVEGRDLPSLGTADPATLHRTKVNSNGGEFDNGPMYLPVNGTGAVGDRVGANIMIDFKANDLVEAPVNGIALIQTVKGVTDRVSGTNTINAARDQGNTAVGGDADDTGLVAGSGVAVDVPIHRPGRNAPNNNPIYGVGFGAAAPSTTLSDGTPTVGRTQRGAHVRNAATGAFDPPVLAQMEDGPGRRIAVAGQSFEMWFEVTALVTDGPMKDTYLGSVEWGWQSDAAGIVTLKPFVALASGAPTATFMGAAGVWNAATFHNRATGATTDSVDLPLTTLPSGVRAAVDMRTPEILTRIPVVRGEIAGIAAGPGVDRTNKEFELRALETELRQRNIRLILDCATISDTGGAANPPEDEVWIALTGGGTLATTLTAIRKFHAGDSHTYSFSVANHLPLDAPLNVEVNEHDRAGTTSQAHDDVLIGFDWSPPFGPVVQRDAGGHYTATIDFDK
jgi:hypothetical protein